LVETLPTSSIPKMSTDPLQNGVDIPLHDMDSLSNNNKSLCWRCRKLRIKHKLRFRTLRFRFMIPCAFELPDLRKFIADATGPPLLWIRTIQNEISIATLNIRPSEVGLDESCAFCRLLKANLPQDFEILPSGWICAIWCYPNHPICTMSGCWIQDQSPYQFEHTSISR
jgi:hypothetical protein